MTARAVLAKASAVGVQIKAANGNLSLKGDEHLVAQLLPDVKAHKPELLVLLAANDPTLATSPALPSTLERRIEFVGKYHGFTNEELSEAKEIAAGDIEAATVCFRALLAKILASSPG